MRGRLPTGLAGQVLAVGLLLLVLLVGWAAVGTPLLAWHGERADALEGRRTLERRMGQIAATLPTLQAQAAPGRAPETVSVLAGGSDAVAGAELQQLVQGMAGQAGAVLASAEVLPAEQMGAYRRIGLRVSVNAVWPVLVGLLEGIEAARPGMAVDDLQLHGGRGFIRDKAAPLDASWVVLAFRAGAGP